MLNEIDQVFPVLILGQRLRQSQQIFRGDVAFIVGDFLDAGDLEPLAVFNRGDEVARLEKAFMGARIEPGHAPTQKLHLQFTLFQVFLVDVGYLQFAPRRGLQILRDIDDGVVVEIEPDNGIVGLGSRRLLFQTDDLALPVERDNAISLGVLHPIAEDKGAIRQCAGFFQYPGEAVAVEDVVAEDETDIILPDEGLPDDKGLSETTGIGLLFIAQEKAQMRAIAEKLFIERKVPGSGDDQNFPDACKHQDRQGIVDHGLVKDREKLLRYGGGDGVEARA